jgi:pyruvate dehydrogenase E2 component (dihydrolipoamide acetyltransferase)
MMTTAFKLPDPGEGIHEAEIVEVCVSQGDKVREGDIVLHIETDKATVEVPSPMTGTIAEIRVQTGDIVQVGEVLITFTDETQAEPETSQPPEAGSKADAQPQAEVASERPTSGDQAAPDEAVEHDEQHVAAKQDEPNAMQTNDNATDRPVPASPATRRLARELGVRLHDVNGSGPGGRVIAEDVRAAAGEAATEPETTVVSQEDTPSAATGAESGEQAVATEPERPFVVEQPPLPDFSRWGPVEAIPLRSVRRATATQMSLAWSQIPHVMHQDVADITELERFRRRHTAEIEERGGKLSLTVLVMQATVATLKQFPRFNASLDPESGQMILKHYYHVGVAVDTERGLLVPVVRDVDRKSMSELAIELTDLTVRTRQGKLEREALQGGTFTITNPGSIGGTAATPIINYPEVAILGLARARLEPVVQGDLDRFTIKPRLRLPLHLAFDHRVNDGADAARFVRTMIDLLGDPESLMLRA